MTLKIFGVILIIVGCGGFGFRIANNYRAEERNIRQLIGIIDFMKCELQYRLTPLPELCRMVSAEFSAPFHRIFKQFTSELNEQISPDAERCMMSSLHKVQAITPKTRDCLLLLGKSFGRFDLDGQIKGLDAVRQECKRNLDILCNNRDARLRSYQTLGLCAGAALAILLI